MPGKGKRRAYGDECALVFRHAQHRPAAQHGIWQRLIVTLDQQRLVIEGLQLRHATAHEKKDHSFRLRREVGQAGKPAGGGRVAGRH